MATLVFPPPPLTVGQEYTGPNGVAYTWDGAVWAAGTGISALWSDNKGTALMSPVPPDRSLSLAADSAVHFGDPTTGACPCIESEGDDLTLEVPGTLEVEIAGTIVATFDGDGVTLGTDPTAPLQAATKQYVDAHGGTPGPTGPPGPKGDPGPPGGAVLSGWWDYNTSTSPPPSSGQIRTSPTSVAVNDPVTVYLHHTDRDGLDWSGVPAISGDTLYMRDDGGNSYAVTIGSVTNTVPGPTGYSTIVGTLTSATGTPPKKAAVQVSVAQQAAAGPPGPAGPQGPKGDTGATGATGPAGPGVAAGGTTGQVLAKTSATDYATAWTTPPTTLPPSGPAGGDLAGSSYPAPTIAPGAVSNAKLASGIDAAKITTGTLPIAQLPPQALLWTAAGATLTPTDATKTVAVPGGAAGAGVATVLLGSNTGKAHVQSSNLTAAPWLALATNRDAVTNAQDDATKPSWQFTVNSLADNAGILRQPAGGSAAALWTLDNTGLLTLPGSIVAPDVSALLLGTFTSRLRVMAPNFDFGGITYNSKHNGTAWVRDDATKPGWRVVLRSGADSIAFEHADTADVQATLFTVGSAGNLTITGPTATKASGTTWANPSDPRLKRDVTPYSTGLAAILALHPIAFFYNGKGGTTDDGRQCYGYDASAVQQALPECVSVRRGKLDERDDEDTDILTLDTSNFTLALINAVKELAARVAALEARVTGAPAPEGSAA